MDSLKLAYTHSWNLTPEEAVQVQQKLREKVKTQTLPPEQLKTVGGVDVGFRGDMARAAAVLLDYPALEILEQEVVEEPLTYPYIPGLLSFREIPAVLAALKSLSRLPDVILCDGHGLAHPRRLGIACHLGVLLDHPTIGCAKSILVGHGEQPDIERGSVTSLVEGDEVIGKLVRTRNNVKPIIVSVGHLVDLDSAVEIVLACGSGYRLPKPTRQADRLASRRGSS